MENIFVNRIIGLEGAQEFLKEVAEFYGIDEPVFVDRKLDRLFESVEIKEGGIVIRDFFSDEGEGWHCQELYCHYEWSIHPDGHWEEYYDDGHSWRREVHLPDGSVQESWARHCS